MNFNHRLDFKINFLIKMESLPQKYNILLINNIDNYNSYKTDRITQKLYFRKKLSSISGLIDSSLRENQNEKRQITRINNEQ